MSESKVITVVPAVEKKILTPTEFSLALNRSRMSLDNYLTSQKFDEVMNQYPDCRYIGSTLTRPKL